MTATNPLPRLRATLAILIGLVTAACSKPEPQTPAPVASAPAAATATMPMDHAAMGTADAGQAMDPNVPMAMATAETSGTFGSGQIGDGLCM